MKPMLGDETEEEIPGVSFASGMDTGVCGDGYRQIRPSVGPAAAMVYL